MRILERRAATALYRILRGRGDRRPWVVPANACPVVACCFQAAGVPMKLVDLDPGTLLPSEDRTLELVERGGFGGVLFIRTYGFIDDRSRFFRALREAERELTIVDDRAVCEPELSGELPEGVDALLFSTGPRKPVDMGWGGGCIARPRLPYLVEASTFSEDVRDQVDAAVKKAVAAGDPLDVRHARWLDAREVTEGEASDWFRRLPESLELARALRGERNAIYAGAIRQSCRLGSAYDTWRFQLRVPRAGVLIDELFSAGLFASRHYASLGRWLEPGTRFPVAEALERDVVNLFNDHNVTREMADRTAAIVSRHIDRHPVTE